MEAEDSAMNNYPHAETNAWPSVVSANEKIDRPVWELQQYKKSELPQINITALYPEILVNIFSYLDIKDLCSITRVCKSLREVAYSKCLWKDIEVTLDSEERNSALFASLAQRGIKKLHIRYIEKHLPDIVELLPNIESLNLSSISKTALHFTILDVSDCRQVTDTSVGQIALHCKNLTELLLDNCSSVSDCSLMLIACGLKKLKVLSLYACNDITNFGIKYIVGHRCYPLSDGNRLLESLTLEGCTKITDAALRYLSDGVMKHLKTLNLSFCMKITDIGLKYLSKISSLRELKAKSCPNITNVGIEHMVQGGCKVDVSASVPSAYLVGGMGGLVIFNCDYLNFNDSNVHKFFF